MNSIEGGNRGGSRSIGSTRAMGGIPHSEGGIATASSFPMPEGGIPMTDTRSVLPHVAPMKNLSWESVSLDTHKSDESTGPFKTLWSASEKKASPYDKVMGPSVPLIVRSFPSQDRRMISSPSAWSEIRFDKPAATQPVDTSSESSFIKIVQIPRASEVEVTAATQEFSGIETGFESAIQASEQTQAEVENAVTEIRTEFSLAREIGEMQIDGVPQEVIIGMAQRAFAQSIESKHLTPFMEAAVSSEPVVKEAQNIAEAQQQEGSVPETSAAVVTKEREQPETTPDKVAVLGTESIVHTAVNEEVQPRGGSEAIVNTKEGRALNYKASVIGDADDTEATKPEAKTQSKLAADAARHPALETQSQREAVADEASAEMKGTKKDAIPGQNPEVDDASQENQWIRDEETNEARAKELREAVLKVKEKETGDPSEELSDESTRVMNTVPINEALLSHGEDPDQLPVEQVVVELEGKEANPELQSEPLRPIPSAVDGSWTEAVEAVASLDDLTPEDAEKKFKEILDDKTAVTIVDFSHAQRPTDEQIQRVIKNNPVDLEAFRQKKAA